MTDAHAQTRIIAGRYELHERLGGGGMGVVWHARDTVLDRDVAVKEILVPQELEPEEREQAKARVRREARSAARLSDAEGVVTVYDVLDLDGDPWVVMQLVRGRSLAEQLRAHGPLPEQQVAAIGAVLARALSSAHANGVVHRDVKPANVMLADDGRVLLTDFGIATVEGETSVTRTGSIVGSPEYMAPERLEDNRATVPASDLWSLGATLYAAAEGETPFRRDTLSATLAAVVSAPVPEPRQARTLTPLLLSLLDRDPTQRLTAPQVARMLGGSSGGVGATLIADAPPGANSGGTASLAGTPTRPVSVFRRVGRRGRLIALGVAAALVLVLVAVLGWRFLIWPTEVSVYSEYSTDHYVVQYPADWEVHEEDGQVAFMPEDEDSEVRLSTASYTQGFADSDDEFTAHSELARLSGPNSDLDAYQQTMLDPAEFGEWDLDVAAAETTFEDPSRDDPHGTSITLRFVDDDRGWWLIWSGPTSERDRSDAVIREILGSYRPLTDN